MARCLWVNKRATVELHYTVTTPLDTVTLLYIYIVTMSLYVECGVYDHR